jgi:release factor glutamine methyltransferase
MASIAEILQATVQRLKRAGVPNPVVDAECLLEAVTGLSRSALRLERDRTLEQHVLEQLEGLVQRRQAREPLQWILGHVEFYGVPLRVQPGVLIPRFETERLLEIALERLACGARVVDIGTGSGAIALALKHERPDLNVFATDLSLDAVNLTLENARTLNLEIIVQHGDLLVDLRGPWDAIISNPPYLPQSDAAHLEPEVQHDPHEALFSGVDGLEIARLIVSAAQSTLEPGGLLAMELDPRNVFVLQTELLESKNTVWDDVFVHQDLAGRDRFLTATRAPKPDNTTNVIHSKPMTDLPAIALDVGEARIGFAACDPKGRFVFGRGYYTRSKLEADVNAVKTLLEQERANLIVVGLPLRTDGADSPQTTRVRAFAAALEAAGLLVTFQDERFTTRIATQNLMGQSKKKRQEKGNTDEASAVAILETWLQRRPKA